MPQTNTFQHVLVTKVKSGLPIDWPKLNPRQKPYLPAYQFWILVHQNLFQSKKLQGSCCGLMFERCQGVYDPVVRLVSRRMLMPDKNGSCCEWIFLFVLGQKYASIIHGFPTLSWKQPQRKTQQRAMNCQCRGLHLKGNMRQNSNLLHHRWIKGITALH